MFFYFCKTIITNNFAIKIQEYEVNHIAKEASEELTIINLIRNNLYYSGFKEIYLHHLINSSVLNKNDHIVDLNYIEPFLGKNYLRSSLKSAYLFEYDALYQNYDKTFIFGLVYDVFREEEKHSFLFSISKKYVVNISDLWLHLLNVIPKFYFLKLNIIYEESNNIYSLYCLEKDNMVFIGYIYQIKQHYVYEIDINKFIKHLNNKNIYCSNMVDINVNVKDFYHIMNRISTSIDIYDLQFINSFKDKICYRLFVDEKQCMAINHLLKDHT